MFGLDTLSETTTPVISKLRAELLLTLGKISQLQDNMAADAPLDERARQVYDEVVTELLDAEYRTRLNLDMCDHMLVMLKELGL